MAVGYTAADQETWADSFPLFVRTSKMLITLVGPMHVEDSFLLRKSLTEQSKQPLPPMRNILVVVLPDQLVAAIVQAYSERCQNIDNAMLSTTALLENEVLLFPKCVREWFRITGRDLINEHVDFMLEYSVEESSFNELLDKLSGCYLCPVFHVHSNSMLHAIFLRTMSMIPKKLY